MPDESEDTYLLEAMSALAGTAFRPAQPRFKCDCGDKIDALRKELKEAEKKTPEDHSALAYAFTIGVFAGFALRLWRRHGYHR